MKTLILFFLMTINFSIYAQKSIFVRVYNSSGIIIGKGHVLIITDSSLQLSGKNSNIIPVSSIGYIKTKLSASAGHKLLGGSIIGGVPLTILGALSSSGSRGILGYSAAEGAAGGFLIGATIGAGIAGLGILLKESKSYSIDGDLLKWKVFQLMLTDYIVK